MDECNRFLFTKYAAATEQAAAGYQPFVSSRQAATTQAMSDERTKAPQIVHDPPALQAEGGSR